MKADSGEAGKLSSLVKIIWPEHTLEELTRIIFSYMNSENSAVFAEIVNGEYAGVALCCLRHDYVEGCETSPVGYLEGVSIQEEYRHDGSFDTGKLGSLIGSLFGSGAAEAEDDMPHVDPYFSQKYYDEAIEAIVIFSQENEE